jgi:hexokinase
VLIDLHKKEDCNIFADQDVSKLGEAYSLDAGFLAAIEEDPFENLSEVQDLFHNTLALSTTAPERELIRRLAELIGTRAARLSACGVAAICKMKGWDTCHVGADGSVFNKYPHFKVRGAQALKEILGWGEENGKGEGDPVELFPAEDGSGVGAALIAALTLERVMQGQNAGIKDAGAMKKAAEEAQRIKPHHHEEGTKA